MYETAKFVMVIVTLKMMRIVYLEEEKISCLIRTIRSVAIIICISTFAENETMANALWLTVSLNKLKFS